MKQLLYVILAVGFFSACNSTPKTEEENKVEALKKEIMASHDTTMAEMNPMAKMRSTLKKAAADTSQADSIRFTEAYRDLQKASDAMMKWMAQFENPDEMLVSDEEKMEYLKEQKRKMKAIEDETFEAIKNARTILGTKEV